MANPKKTFDSGSFYGTPWSLRERVAMLVWEYVWLILCSWTPKPMLRWRQFWLKLFGATFHGNALVHQRARIHKPWNLVIHQDAAIGDRVNLYNQDIIEIGPKARISAECFLCTATHDFNSPTLPLVTAKINIGENAFLGIRATIMPGVDIGSGAIVGACAVVTKDVPAGAVYAGNPARPIAFGPNSDPASQN
jgi:putative colanic acid biosynthesis acetyltransferase WcaF